LKELPPPCGRSDLYDPPGIGQHSRLEPDDIARAPELAILEALDAALETAVVAVMAANPALVGPDPFEPDWDDHPPPSARLSAADAVIYVTHALRAALDRYRCVTRPAPNERPPI
jgi:hypothetical protein